MENPSQTTAISKDIFTEMVMQEAIKDKTIQYMEELKNQGKAFEDFQRAR